jgi:hypothetical protein
VSKFLNNCRISTRSQAEHNLYTKYVKKNANQIIGAYILKNNLVQVLAGSFVDFFIVSLLTAQVWLNLVKNNVFAIIPDIIIRGNHSLPAL